MAVTIPVKADDLFRLILPADQILPSFFGDVSPAKLIVADPNDGLFTAVKLDILYGIGDM